MPTYRLLALTRLEIQVQFITPVHSHPQHDKNIFPHETPDFLTRLEKWGMVSPS
jgi:hypothetical protein